MINKLLIFDIDSTLLDWTHYFYHCHKARVDFISKVTNISVEELNAAYKTAVQLLKDIEYPFAFNLTTMLMPLIATRGTLQTDMISREQLLFVADKKFKNAMKEHLFLYPGINEIFQKLIINTQNPTVTAIAYTDATPYNAILKLNKLGITNYFQKIYTKKGLSAFDLAYEEALEVSNLQILKKGECKPNPEVLARISYENGFQPSETIYIGDSLTKDIKPANDCGMTTVWAEYGMNINPVHWEYLKTISAMTPKQIEHHIDCSFETSNTTPEFIVKDSRDLLKTLEHILQS